LRVLFQRRDARRPGVVARLSALAALAALSPLAALATIPTTTATAAAAALRALSTTATFRARRRRRRATAAALAGATTRLFSAAFGLAATPTPTAPLALAGVISGGVAGHAAYLGESGTARRGPETKGGAAEPTTITSRPALE
jgi:peptidoglycan/LPS O-acetylase OafA/YrhL